MVPFSAVTEVSGEAGPPSVQRYNGYPARTISGNAAPGYSSGVAVAEMERLAEHLPEGFAYEWTGISYAALHASVEATVLMGLSLLVVFLLLGRFMHTGGYRFRWFICFGLECSARCWRLGCAA